MKEYMDLTRLDENEKGIVREITGGRGFVNKLEMLGIREGMEIIKVSGIMMRGPVVVRAGNTQAAIGYGMARRIFVEKEK